MFGGDNTDPMFPALFNGGNQVQLDSNALQLQLFGTVPMVHNVETTNYIQNGNAFTRPNKRTREMDEVDRQYKLQISLNSSAQDEAVRSANIPNTNAFPVSHNVNTTNYVRNDNILTLNPSNKRIREMEDAERQYKLQISLNSFGQDEAVGHSASIPNTNAVSTGLRLSYDDEEYNSSVTSASASIPSIPVMASLGDNLRIEIDRQNEELNHYIRVQEEHIMKGLKEMKQRHTSSFLSTIEKGVGRKLREKELEIESMNSRSRELIERIKQVTMEAESWHNKAKYNESLVNVLKSNLQQALSQGADQGKEGCGDSEVDDTTSSYNPLGTTIPGAIHLGQERNVRGPNNRTDGRQKMVCKSCKNKEICMLLLPCRHLCLCRDCSLFIDVCPVCQTSKTANIQVHMS